MFFLAQTDMSVKVGVKGVNTYRNSGRDPMAIGLANYFLAAPDLERKFNLSPSIAAIIITNNLHFH